MDCCICTSLPHMLRLPRNTICDACFKGAKSMASLLNQLHLTENPIHKSNDSLVSQPNLPKAIRSEIFKNMLDSDGCKAPPNDNTITLPELNYEELESLLEFLYKGSLSEEKMKKHVICLSLAADKYHITYLQKMCEHHLLTFLNSSNVLGVLQMTNNVCSYQTLKETAFNFIPKNIKDIVFSSEFDAFTYSNPHLTVQIMRASFKVAH